MLGHNRIISHKKSDHKVHYYRINLSDSIDIIYGHIIDLLNDGYQYDDIFILSPSLKNADNPGKKLENLLVKKNIPVYFTRNDEDGIDERMIANKIVFTTFHQSKGRERKIVFVFGFDDSYFKFYATNKNVKFCPSELYVAVTRASEILFVIENEKYPPLSFLKKTPCQLKKYMFLDYYSNTSSKKKIIIKTKNNPIHKTTVKELTMYLSEITMNLITPLINMLFINLAKPKKKRTTNIPLYIETEKGLVEDVSDINGIVIPALYELNSN